MNGVEEFQNLPVLFFVDDKGWEAWLSKHFSDPGGAWLKFAKKDSGIDSLRYKEALDVALCYGWIDGLSKRIDATYFTSPPLCSTRRVTNDVGSMRAIRRSITSTSLVSWGTPSCYHLWPNIPK